MNILLNILLMFLILLWTLFLVLMGYSLALDYASSKSLEAACNHPYAIFAGCNK